MRWQHISPLQRRIKWEVYEWRSEIWLAIPVPPSNPGVLLHGVLTRVCGYPAPPSYPLTRKLRWTEREAVWERGHGRRTGGGVEEREGADPKACLRVLGRLYPFPLFFVRRSGHVRFPEESAKAVLFKLLFWHTGVAWELQTQHSIQSTSHRKKYCTSG